MSSVALLRLTIGISFLVACYQALVFYLGSQASESFEKLWGYIFLGLLFMYLSRIFYLPYYLIRTRGRIGWLWLLGVIALLYLGTLMQWLVYAAS